MLRSLLITLSLALSVACASDAPPPDPGIVAEVAGEVDVSCERDSDCTVKNIGNCCGYYPACVNTDSPTFPGQVMEQCRREGLAAVCGFRQIEACVCVENRCEASPAAAGAPLQ